MAGDLKNLGDLLSSGTGRVPPPRQAVPPRSMPAARRTRLYDATFNRPRSVFAGDTAKASNIPNEISHSQGKTRHLPKKIWLILASSVILLVIIGTILLLTITKKPANPIPPSLISQLAFPTYYPAKLPAGFTIKPGDVKQPENSKDVVVIHAADTSGRYVDISQQTMLKNFEFSHYFGQFSDQTDVSTPIGTATIGSADGKPILAAIPAGKTLVVISTSRNITMAEFTTILQGLKAN